MLDSIRTTLNSGILRIYSGTRPTDGDTALSGNTVLAECTLNATAAPAASGGALTLAAITQDASANATGTASFARQFESNGTTVVGDLSVSVTGGGGEVQLNSLSITAGGTVSITTGGTITLPVGS